MDLKMKLNLLTILLSATILSSCGTVISQAKLPLPPEVVYPAISGHELQCLTDNVYKKLNTRRALCEARVETLRNIIKSTH